VPTSISQRIDRDCPVVGYSVTLSRERVFLDYILMREGEPTCSNIHACLSNYGDLKNIPECLLHSASKHFRLENGKEKQ